MYVILEKRVTFYIQSIHGSIHTLLCPYNVPTSSLLSGFRHLFTQWQNNYIGLNRLLGPILRPRQ